MYIEYAAIKYPNGEVMVGRRHYKIIAIQAKLGIKTTSDSVQGFVDTMGNFLTREEAVPIAKASGQVPEDFEGLLYSEDLWADGTADMVGME